MTIWEHVQTFHCGELFLDSRLITRKLGYDGLFGDPMGSHEAQARPNLRGKVQWNSAFFRF